MNLATPRPLAEHVSTGFIRSAVVVLVVTTLAKVFAATGDARILTHPDPIFGVVSNRQMVLLAAALEALAVGLILAHADTVRRAAFVAWISTVILACRAGLFWIGYEGSCRCLGNVTDMLGVSPADADMASKLILGYLLLGSYTVLAWAWIARRDLGRTVSPASAMKV